MFSARTIIYILKTVYNDRPHISMYALRMMPAVTFGVTASDDTMRTYVLMLPRVGLGRRLHKKTSATAPIIVNVVDLSRYLDTLYLRIAEEPNITLQRLSAYFVADHCKFCRSYCFEGSYRSFGATPCYF